MSSLRECPYCLKELDVTKDRCIHCGQSVSEFNTETALKTSWAPFTENTFSVVQQELNVISPTRMEFLATQSGKSMVYMTIGAALLSLIAAIMITLADLEDSPAFIFWGFGLMALPVGIIMLKAQLAPKILDLKQGYYWKGMKGHEKAREKCRIADIGIIQVLSEYIHADNMDSSVKRKDPYKYEINLVLNDAKRINLVKSSDLKQIRLDAEKLSDFLTHLCEFGPFEHTLIIINNFSNNSIINSN
jgi:hypothetical protein